MKKYLSVKEFAELLGCSQKTVYRMIKSGRFWTENGEKVIKLRGSYRIEKDAIDILRIKDEDFDIY